MEKHKSVFIEVEPTVNIYSYVLEETKYLGKAICAKQFLRSVKWLPDMLPAHREGLPRSRAVSERSFLSDVVMAKVIAPRVYFCFTSCTYAWKKPQWCTCQRKRPTIISTDLIQNRDVFDTFEKNKCFPLLVVNLLCAAGVSPECEISVFKLWHFFPPTVLQRIQTFPFTES